MPELQNLITASNKVCDHEWDKNGTMVILKKKFRPVPSKQAGGISG
jgi:hypothetical protein